MASKCSLILKTIMVILYCISNPLNIYSDFALGIRFVLHGDIYWGSLTLLFTFLPYTVTWIKFIWDHWRQNNFHNKWNWIELFFLAIGLRSVGISIRSLIYFYQTKGNKAKVMKFFSSQFQTKLIILEDISQFTLQLYVADHQATGSTSGWCGRRHTIDPLLLFSLVTSFLGSLLSQTVSNWHAVEDMEVEIKQERNLSLGFSIFDTMTSSNMPFKLE